MCWCFDYRAAAYTRRHLYTVSLQGHRNTHFSCHQDIHNQNCLESWHSLHLRHTRTGRHIHWYLKNKVYVIQNNKKVDGSFEMLQWYLCFSFMRAYLICSKQDEANLRVTIYDLSLLFYGCLFCAVFSLTVVGMQRKCNSPFYSCVLGFQVFEQEWGQGWPCYDTNLVAFQMQITFLSMLTRYWSLSQQGHLQPHSKLKAWRLSTQP